MPEHVRQIRKKENPMILYHGTRKSSAINIINNGIDLHRGKKRADFGKGFYLTPSLVFKCLDKKYKEKYDFQFSWLNINYRKLIGERTKYKTVLAEELNKPIDWSKIFQK